ncbi:OB-fold domain-containing protein [Mycobacterium syngnathidarum]
MTEAVFGPTGTVWSSTVIRIPIPGRTPPYGIAYVNLDDGPRVTVHTAADPADGPVPVGTRVRISGTNDTGDVEVEVIEK